MKNQSTKRPNKLDPALIRRSLIKAGIDPVPKCFLCGPAGDACAKSHWIVCAQCWAEIAANESDEWRWARTFLWGDPEPLTAEDDDD